MLSNNKRVLSHIPNVNAPTPWFPVMWAQLSTMSNQEHKFRNTLKVHLRNAGEQILQNIENQQKQRRRLVPNSASTTSTTLHSSIRRQQTNNARFTMPLFY